MKKKENKIKIDERFKKMFDDDFELNKDAPVDKYGRKVKKNRKEDLKSLYYIDENDENDEKLEELNVFLEFYY